MKLKTCLTYCILAGILSLPSTTAFSFDFDSPFDWFDDDDDYSDYRYGGRRGGYGGYGRDRWKRYDEWEPNYWRYRYFDDDSDDYIFDDFDGGDFFGDGNGRGRFNFDMNMDTDFDGDFDGDYDDDYRYRGDRYGRDYGRNYGRDYDRGGFGGLSRRPDRYRSGSRYNDDRYNDDYWRNYSRRYGDSSRRMSRTPEEERRRSERKDRQPVECR